MSFPSAPPAKKRFGQHFLTDGGIADRIVASANLAPGDPVLEIGPGRGVLTGRLLDTGGNVTAVELDRDLTGLLTKTFGDRPGFRLVMADILRVDLAALYPEKDQRITVVSNLPYNISTAVVELLCQYHHLVKRAVLMVQREVADRLVADHGSRAFGLTTLNLALWATSSVIIQVPPGSFTPPPEVHSSVILLEFSGTPVYPLADRALFHDITGAAFRQRRKMVRNTLIPFLVARGCTETTALELLAKAGIAPTARPETISPGSFTTLVNLLVPAP